MERSVNGTATHRIDRVAAVRIIAIGKVTVGKPGTVTILPFATGITGGAALAGEVRAKN